MGLYSVVAGLFALLPEAKRVGGVSWRGKEAVSFSDALCAVRRWLWAEAILPQAGAGTEFEKLPGPARELLLIHVICDNAGIHKPDKSKAVRKYLAEWSGRVVLHYRPAYSPDTNPVERVWWRRHEAVKQLVSEARTPLPPRPGTPARCDYEYRREGVANLFMISEPLLGWRHVRVTDRRTAVGFAEALWWVVEGLHPGAGRVVLVTDNLNAHHPGSLHEASDPARARRIVEKLEWHYTPKHGSWLNVAECEPAALPGQCLDRRIGSLPRLRQVVAAWEDERNERQVGVDGRFRTADARIKLKRLYPAAQK
jgi:transposase